MTASGLVWPHVDKSAGPRCLLWHGWLPSLACLGGGSPWADSAEDIGFNRLECALGSYIDAFCREWVSGDLFLADLAGSRIPEYLDVWTQRNKKEEHGNIKRQHAGRGKALCMK